jgi:enoyl-CoA hydratase
MTMTNLLCDTDGRVRVITMNRPEKLNALNHQTLVELRQAMQEAVQDAAIDIVIITGAGEKAFVAGADIAELHEQDALNGLAFAEFGQGTLAMIAQSPKPVIAAVNGFALGGGCELAIACHIRYASENARFGQPEVNLGTIPGYGGTQRLARLVGYGRAMELVLSGAMTDAQEAYRIGLVNKVVPKGEVLQAAKELANTIISKGQVAVRLALEAVRSVQETGLEEGLRREAALFGLSCGSADFKEGTQAFLEKRPASFTGR